MFKLKKIVICVLAVVMVLAMGTTAFAGESSDVVYIDVSMFSADELDAVVREAQNGVNTVVVSWEDATVVIKPIIEPEVVPCFNLDKTYSLSTTWTSLGTDWPIFEYHLKVTNKSGNPGAIDICVKRPDYVLGEEYCWGLNPGYYAEFDLAVMCTSELWVKASSVSGSYGISAKCS